MSATAQAVRGWWVSGAACNAYKDRKLSGGQLGRERPWQHALLPPSCPRERAVDRRTWSVAGLPLRANGQSDTRGRGDEDRQMLRTLSGCTEEANACGPRHAGAST